jgi:hypothetical protein
MFFHRSRSEEEPVFAKFRISDRALSEIARLRAEHPDIASVSIGWFEEAEDNGGREIVWSADVVGDREWLMRARRLDPSRVFDGHETPIVYAGDARFAARLQGCLDWDGDRFVFVEDPLE